MVAKTDKDDSDGALFRIARQTRLPLMLETHVIVNRTTAGIMLIDSHPNIAKPLV